MSQNTWFFEKFEFMPFNKLFKAHSQGIVWNVNWAYACDFYENNLSNARTSADTCGPQCESTSGCTHFTWNNYEGGTCWMKRGPVSKNDAFSTGDYEMVCGVALKYM